MSRCEIVFFIKQKTAYEMRISDWSSDVCSSDLQTFLEGINEEVVFDGGWNPDPNELLFTPVTDEAAAVFAAAQGNVVAMPEVNAAGFAEEDRKSTRLNSSH